MPKLLDHIRATGALNDNSRMTGVIWCRGSWRHFGTAGTMKTRAAQRRGSNSVEATTQRLVGFQQRRGSAYVVQSNKQRRALEGRRRAATEGASISRCSQNDLYISILGDVLQLLTSQQLSCSATVSSGSALGSMMQQFEREL